tara:strand:- start:383 stop:640 length:258 start_codon:yes stop_codon:yes gene_type:complete
MAKVASNKVSKTELKNIKEAQEALDSAIRSVGALEYKKSVIMKSMHEAADKVENLKNKLEKKYGSVNINLETGDMTKIEQPVAAS